MSKKITKTISVKNKHPGGRPTKYTPELAKRIVDAIATSTIGISRICDKNLDFPCKDTIFEWRLKHREFSDQYAIARQIQADLCAEEIQEIADNCELTTEAINKAKLQIESRKWTACKLVPKVYGDKVQNDTTVTLTHEKALEQLK